MSLWCIFGPKRGCHVMNFWSLYLFSFLFVFSLCLSLYIIYVIYVYTDMYIPEGYFKSMALVLPKETGGAGPKKNRKRILIWYLLVGCTEYMVYNIWYIIFGIWYLESLWLIIMGYFKPIMVYFGV